MTKNFCSFIFLASVRVNYHLKSEGALSDFSGQNWVGLYKTLEKFTEYFSRKPTYVYVIEMTYTTIGVKLVVMGRYGVRFVVLKHPLFE